MKGVPLSHVLVEFLIRLPAWLSLGDLDLTPSTGLLQFVHNESTMVSLWGPLLFLCGGLFVVCYPFGMNVSSWFFKAKKTTFHYGFWNLDLRSINAWITHVVIWSLNNTFDFGCLVFTGSTHGLSPH